MRFIAPFAAGGAAVAMLVNIAAAQPDYGHLNMTPQYAAPQLQGGPSQFPSMSNAPRPNLGSMTIDRPMPPNYKPSLSLSRPDPPPFQLEGPQMYRQSFSEVPLAPPTMEHVDRARPAMTRPAFSGNVMPSFRSLPIYRTPEYGVRPMMLNAYSTGLNGFTVPREESLRYSLSTGAGFLLEVPHD